jgi:hypothetical protein
MRFRFSKDSHAHPLYTTAQRASAWDHAHVSVRRRSLRHVDTVIGNWHAGMRNGRRNHATTPKVERIVLLRVRTPETTMASAHGMIN